MTDRRLERILALAFLLLGLAIAWQSARIGFVAYGIPAAGFFPFWAGLAITVSAAILLLAPGTVETDGERIRWRQPVLLMAAVAAYFAVFELLGALLSTVLFMLVALLVLSRQPAMTVLTTITASLVLIYLLFETWLGTPLPHGLIG